MKLLRVGDGDGEGEIGLGIAEEKRVVLEMVSVTTAFDLVVSGTTTFWLVIFFKNGVRRRLWKN